MILHDPVLNKKARNRYIEKRIILKAIADEVVQDSRVFLAHSQPRIRVEGITPLLLHGAYQAMAILGSNSDASEAEAVDVLEQKLIFVGRRWNAGGSSFSCSPASRYWH
jgi:hypothetical protein